CGYLEMSSPTIPEALYACVERGARRVIAVPYFLHTGMHMIRDIPRVLREEAQRYPDVEIVLGRHIGDHPHLSEVLLDRIQGSLTLPDIRSATIDAAYYSEP